jgi:hypothetical protein
MRMAVDERTPELSVETKRASPQAARTEASDVDFFGKALAGELVSPGPFKKWFAGRMFYRPVPGWAGGK